VFSDTIFVVVCFKIVIWGEEMCYCDPDDPLEIATQAKIKALLRQIRMPLLSIPEFVEIKDNGTPLSTLRAVELDSEAEAKTEIKAEANDPAPRKKRRK
jgi:hypothetical protein